MHGVPLGKMSTGSTGLQESFNVVRQHRLQESTTRNWQNIQIKLRNDGSSVIPKSDSLLSHMQLCNPCVSQYGIHFPPLHWPRSKHVVSSGIGGLGGQSGDLPVHVDSCSQVGYWASRHFFPAGMYWQSWQQGEFLSLLQMVTPLCS